MINKVKIQKRFEKQKNKASVKGNIIQLTNPRFNKGYKNNIIKMELKNIPEIKDLDHSSIEGDNVIKGF